MTYNPSSMGSATLQAVLPTAEPTPGIGPPSRPTALGRAFQGVWPKLRRAFQATASGGYWLLGLFSLIIGLSATAAIPVVQLVSLGYLLESSRRVAISGRFRDGFPGVRRAAALGGLVAGAWLVLIPLRLVADIWYSSYLIDPTSQITRNWRVALVIAAALILGHIFACCFSGGRLRYFLWPVAWPFFLPRTLWFGYPLDEWFPAAKLGRALRQGGWYAASRDAVWNYVVSLQLPYLFWLGARGFLGALAWLTVPVLLLIGGVYLEPAAAVLSGLLGGVTLLIVSLHLPMLMTHFAVEGKWPAMFAVREIRQRFRRAPLAIALTAIITLTFAAPLYLLKIPFVPQEIRWLPSLLFVVFIFPARIAQGYAYNWSSWRTQQAWFVTRMFARLIAAPFAAAYVLIVFLSQYLAWYGAASMFEQHAFMLPAPFFGY